MPSPKLKPPHMDSSGAPRWDSRARSSVPSLQTTIPPRAFPSRCIPLSCGSGPRAEPPAAPGAGERGTRGRARERGMPRRQRRRVLPLRSGPLKREWGGRRQPTSWERLLNMQMDIQEVRSNPGVQPPSLLSPTLIAPGARRTRAIRCRAAGCPSGQRPRRAIFPWNLAWKPHSGPRMVNCW